VKGCILCGLKHAEVQLNVSKLFSFLQSFHLNIYWLLHNGIGLYIMLWTLLISMLCMTLPWLTVQISSWAA